MTAIDRACVLIDSCSTNYADSNGVHDLSSLVALIYTRWLMGFDFRCDASVRRTSAIDPPRGVIDTIRV